MTGNTIDRLKAALADRYAIDVHGRLANCQCSGEYSLFHEPLHGNPRFRELVTELAGSLASSMRKE